MGTVVLLPSAISGSTGALSYVDSTGNVTDLDDRESIWYSRGSQGIDLPPLEIIRSSIPYVPGSRVRRTRSAERELHLPFVLLSDSFAGLRALKQTLFRSVWPGDAEGDEVRYGRLRFNLVSGDVREIRALYMEGLEGETANQRVISEEVVISWLCPDPWFEAVEDKVVPFITGGSSLRWVRDRWFPYYLTGSALIDSQSVDNQGDLEAWPIWTLKGPAVNPVFRNLTTSAVLSVPITVPFGGTLTIDTRPGFRRIVDQSGNSVYGTSTGALWSLQRGLNVVSVSAGSTTPTDTLLNMNYRERFLSA